MITFGKRDVWAIEVETLPGGPVEDDPAAVATWARIRIWAAGQNLTAHTRTDISRTYDSLHWPAAFLARWILHTWPAFWERAGSPLPNGLVSAARVCERLDARIANDPEGIDDDFIDERDAFVASHTLLAAAAGGVMPPIYLLKDGDAVFVDWVEAPGSSDVLFHARPGSLRVRADHFLNTIREFMGWCSERVRESASRLSKEIDSWLARLDKPAAAESILFGYLWPWGARAPAAKHSLTPPRMLNLPRNWRQSGALMDPGQFSAAVLFRALSPVVGEQDIKKLWTRLRKCPANPQAAKHIEARFGDVSLEPGVPPYDQGYSLAEQARKRLGNLDQPVDVEAFVQSLGVQVHDEELSNDSIDAATVWDDSHGPVIVVNKIERHAAPWARRMTLAHELCHVLFDKRKSVPLMIASTAWAPPEIEQRANAFAAEFLLPREGILRVARSLHLLWHDEEAVQKQLMDEFEVGATVCLHQVQNRMKGYW